MLFTYFHYYHHGWWVIGDNDVYKKDMGTSKMINKPFLVFNVSRVHTMEKYNIISLLISFFYQGIIYKRNDVSKLLYAHACMHAFYISVVLRILLFQHFWCSLSLVPNRISCMEHGMNITTAAAVKDNGWMDERME